MRRLNCKMVEMVGGGGQIENSITKVLVWHHKDCEPLHDKDNDCAPNVHLLMIPERGCSSMYRKKKGKVITDSCRCAMWWP